MDEQLETLKTKKLIEQLADYKGNGTSMISLYIAAGEQISRVSKMLVEEYATASRIKSRENRQSVMSAISSAQQKLKLYNRTPTNGLALFCGLAIAPDGSEHRVNIDMVPQIPFKRAIYMCSNSFHLKPLLDSLETHSVIGFIVVDGNGCLFGTVCGNNRTIIEEFSVELPKKHGRGGQSALRFARLRMEKRHNYVRKCCENANRIFVKDNKAVISGLVVAGSAAFKTELIESDHFNALLKTQIVSVVDVAYGSKAGFNEAITLSAEALSDVVLFREKILLQNYFQEIAIDSGLSSVGILMTLKALEMGAVEKLLIWEKYPSHGASLCVLSDNTQEGTQFVQGFGGFGGILRWRIIDPTISEIEETLSNLKVDPEDDFRSDEYEQYEDLSNCFGESKTNDRRTEELSMRYKEDIDMMLGEF